MTYQEERAMAGLLPPGMRCSAWWYARARGLPQDLGYLMSLGLTAARMARWEGLEDWQVPERHPDGVTYLVHQWPERIWDAASSQPQVREAESWCCPDPRGEAAYDAVYGNTGRGWDETVPRDGDDIRDY